MDAHSGIVTDRLDTATLQGKMQKPYILIMSLPEDRVRRLRSRRKRQAPGDAVCSELSILTNLYYSIN